MAAVLVLIGVACLMGGVVNADNPALEHERVFVVDAVLDPARVLNNAALA